MTESLDQIFTPESVAASLVALAAGSPGVVLDPTVGEGALLAAATTRWPAARVVGLDVDAHQVSRLRAAGVTAGRCDFLSRRSRAASPVVRSLIGGVDLVLMNPPYSYRGGRRWSVQFAGTGVAVSRSMAFVLNALAFLSPGGELLALLPAGSIESQRDREAWRAVRKAWTVEVVDRFERGTFSAGTATTVAVRICSESNGRDSAGLTRAEPPVSIQAGLVRGVLQVHTARRHVVTTRESDEGSIRFLHSCDLRDGEVVEDWKGVPTSLASRVSRRPAVLVPRVGKPLVGKVALWHGEPVVLSDCLFAIETGSCDEAAEIRSRMVDSFDLLASAYSGSCAPYLTAAALIETLVVLGVGTRWPGAARWTVGAERWWLA